MEGQSFIEPDGKLGSLDLFLDIIADSFAFEGSGGPGWWFSFLVDDIGDGGFKDIVFAVFGYFVEKFCIFCLEVG